MPAAVEVIPQPVPQPPSRAGATRHDLLTVFALALALRLVVGAITANTYDYDEFVVLALARDFAHGAVPYRDFMFFHPPGALLFFRTLEPLTASWWPVARVVTALLDSLTAVLVCTVGRSLFSAGPGRIAGILYAVSPVALIAGVRVGQDPLITFLGVAGLTLLLRTTSWRGAALAGGCLGLAIATKYPAVLLLPVYVLVAWRRSPATVLAAGAGFLLMLLPFRPEWHALYQQTVVFQRARGEMAFAQRLRTTGLYWLAANPLALPGMLMRPRRPWLVLGFLLGGALLFASQVYYHYFMAFVPFGALLSAPVLARWRIPAAVAVPSVAVAACLWAGLIALGGPRPAYVTAAHLSDVRPTAALLRRVTAPDARILGDRFEYAYLADRAPLTPYFWNVRVLVKASWLLRQLPRAGAVVMSRDASSSGYPYGMTQYLNRHYVADRTPATTVWVLRRPMPDRAHRRATG